MPKLSSQARNALPERQFAVPAQRKEPLENASHVRNAGTRERCGAGTSTPR